MKQTDIVNLWYLSLLKWRERKIKTSNFILVLSFLVGIFTALAAFFLKNAIHFIQHILTTNFSVNHENYLYLAYPSRARRFRPGWDNRFRRWRYAPCGPAAPA